MNKSIITPDNIFSSTTARLVNFREIRMGSIAPNTLYRSSHPICDNKQEKTIALMASYAKIAAVINLCDSLSGITTKALYAPWYNKLLKTGRVIALDMDFSCTSAGFKRKLKEGLQFVINTEGPWLIHCHAGVDRTGFVSMVLEAFMGAAMDDVINDYLESFSSGFESSIFEPNKTDSLVALQLLSVMSNSQAINEHNLQRIAETYLRTSIGLSAEETKLLWTKLTEKNNVYSLVQ